MAQRVGDILRQARARLAGASETPDLDAELLLGHVLGVARVALRAVPERELDPAAASRFEALLARRAAGEPLAYLTGRKGFWTLELDVDAAVLVPRPETELLVEAAVGGLRSRPAPRVLDLGTGSGAVALAIAAELPAAEVVGVDSSAAAIRLARRNAAAAGLDRVRFLPGHWYEPLAGRRFHCIVANPPYLAEDDPHLQDLAHEPVAALVAGPTGLEALAEIIDGAGAHLEPGGTLLLEHAPDQGGAVRARCTAAGLEAAHTLTDLAGLERVTLARGPAARRPQG